MDKWIRILTWSRLPLACAVALAWTFEKFELGAWLFAAGLLTKAADTPLSVWRKCPIPADDEFYRMTAVLWSCGAIVGLTNGFFTLSYYGKLPWFVAVLPLVTTAAVMTITRLFVKPHSLLAKARSGFVSVLILFFTAPYAPIWLSFASLGLIYLGEGYKLIYYSQTETQRSRQAPHPR